MQLLLVGYGEIGKGVYDVFSKYHSIDIVDPSKGYNIIRSNFIQYDLMLITIPYSDKFIDIVNEYKHSFNVQNVLVFSTTQIGTCKQLGACHSPVEGKHPNLAESINRTYKWLGGNASPCIDMCKRFFEESDFHYVHLEDSNHTEFLKLRSTTVYGVNIEFARYSKATCDDLNMDYDLIKMWDQWVNDLYASFDMNWATRYVLDAPSGPKGGHCVTPNAKLLNKIYPNTLVKVVAEE